MTWPVPDRVAFLVGYNNEHKSHMMLQILSVKVLTRPQFIPDENTVICFKYAVSFTDQRYSSAYGRKQWDHYTHGYDFKEVTMDQFECMCKMIHTWEAVGG